MHYNVNCEERETMYPKKTAKKINITERKSSIRSLFYNHGFFLSRNKGISCVKLYQPCRNVNKPMNILTKKKIH